MKKLLLATVLILGLTTVPVYAQEKLPPDEAISREEDEQIVDDVEIQIQEDQAEDTQTLSEELEVQQTQEVGFLTILFAILTPALLIVVAYLLIRMSNK